MESNNEFKISKMKLLYDNAHKYRFHADNLRWMIFIGYMGIFSVFRLVDQVQIGYIFLWLFSLTYIFIMAVQHWFYNAFSKYAQDCDVRMSESKELETLQEFIKENGSNIKLNHPAYTFALATVAVCASYFLSQSIVLVFNINISPIISTPNYSISLVDIIIYLLFASLHIIFVMLLSRKWNVVHNKFIVRWSNLWTVNIEAPSGTGGEENDN